MEGILAKTGNDYILYSKDNSVLGITSGTIEGRKLSLHNCEDIERGYNLDVLAEERTKNQLIRLLGGEDREEVLDDIKKRKFYFIEGAKAILEILSDKKFSVSDMEKLMFKTIEFTEQEQGETYPFFKSFIQSLQPKEWDVEICCYIGNGDKESDSFKDPLVTNTGIPKLNEDGCLILKRK